MNPKWLSGKMGSCIMLWIWNLQLGGLIASGKREEISIPWNLDLGYSLPNSQLQVPGPQPESKTTIPCSRASWTGESKLLPQISFMIQCCWCNLSSSEHVVNHYWYAMLQRTIIKNTLYIPSLSSGKRYATSSRLWYRRSFNAGDPCTEVE